jgi:TP901 family phage tail tape measure protein
LDLGHLSIEVRAKLGNTIASLRLVQAEINKLSGTAVKIGGTQAAKSVKNIGTGVSKVTAETNKSVMAAKRYEDQIGRNTKAVARQNIELRKEVKEAGVVYKAGMRERPTKAPSAMYDPYTKKLVAKYAKIPGIDPATIRSFEQFNMAGKLTDVRLKANTLSGKKMGETFTVLQKKSGRWVSPLGKLNDGLNNLRWTMVNVMFATMALGAIASPFIMATKWAMEYEVALKRISAVTGTSVTEIRSDILSIRRDTPFAINEVSDAYLAFTKAGFSAAEAAKAVPAILKLSIAGFIDLGEAGKITAQILHQFSLDATDAARVADVLANAANISAADVQDFGTAIAYVGPTAVSAGLELEEMAGALAILSNAGLRGSRMGTNLRQALSDIIEPSKEAETLMKKMGVSFYDTSGKMKNLDSIITTLRVALSGLATEEERQKALGEMFDIRGMTAINTFINQAKEGKATIAGYTEAVKEVGYANKVAAIQMEASTNQLKIFMENLKTDMVTAFGEALNASFGDLIKYVNDFRELNKEIENLKKIGWIEEETTVEKVAKFMAGAIGRMTGTQIPVNFVFENKESVLKTAETIKDKLEKIGIKIPIEFIHMEKLPEKIGIEPALIDDVVKSLEKWEKMAPEMETLGRVDISVAYKDAEKNLREELKNANERINEIAVDLTFATPERREELKAQLLEIGRNLSSVYEAQKTSISDTTKAELERVAAANSILATYDELTGKLKYSASELKMTEEKYKDIVEKVKEIKELGSEIELGRDIKIDVSLLEKEFYKLKGVFAKEEFFVNVKAMIETRTFKMAFDVLSRSFKNLEEISRIEMLTGADKDVEKVKVKVEELAKTLRGYIRTIEEQKLDIKIVGIEETIADMEAHVATLESAAKRVVALEAAEKNFTRQIRNLRDDLSLANKTLTAHRDKLSEVNKEISRLTGQRFTGETEFLRLIGEQNKYLDEQRLAELGIFDVQKFITDAIKKTTNGYDGLVKSMEKVNKVAEASKNTYDSWKKTVEEFIKASIKSGESLGADVTGKVKKFQTMLLGITDMAGAEKGTTLAEQNLERLKLAYDYYYGGMKEDVKFATMEHEDSVNGIASGSGVVISALQSHWSEQIKLNSAISESSSYVKTLNDTLNDETTSLRDVTDELAIQNTVIKDGTTFIWAQIAAWAELRKNMDAFGGKPKTSYPGTGMSIAPSLKTPDWRETYQNKMVSIKPFDTRMTREEAYRAGYSYSGGAGLSKFNEGGVVNSPTRALIGEAGPEAVIPLDKMDKLGGNISVTVNVRTDANPEEIAREVKRELMSL